VRRLFVLPLILAALASVLVAAPAQAATGGCNGTGLGRVIDSRTPADGIRRNLWALVCYEYDFNSIRNTTYLRCYWDNQTTACNMRAEVLQAKLDRYTSDGTYAGTLANNFFDAGGAGYYTGRAWQGSDILISGGPCAGGQYQSNDFGVRWRLQVNGVLYDAGNAFGVKSSC
jgi:hypothetical protein